MDPERINQLREQFQEEGHDPAAAVAAALAMYVEDAGGDVSSIAGVQIEDQRSGGHHFTVPITIRGNRPHRSATDLI